MSDSGQTFPQYYFLVRTKERNLFVCLCVFFLWPQLKLEQFSHKADIAAGVFCKKLHYKKLQSVDNDQRMMLILDSTFSISNKIYYLNNDNCQCHNMDAKKAANTNIKTNSIKQPLSIWIRNNSSHCIFNCHDAQKDKHRQNIFILQNINEIKIYQVFFPSLETQEA